MGRPTTYSVALAEEVLERVAGGESIYRISQGGGMPHWTVIYGWEDSQPEFSSALVRARRASAECIAQAGLDAVDAPLDLTLDGKVASAGVQRQGNRANYRKWMAGCNDPGRFGNVVQHDVRGVLAVVTLPLDLMLPAATVQAEGGRTTHDPRVLELRRLAAYGQRPTDAKATADEP